jgi:hypothetical protein
MSSVPSASKAGVWGSTQRGSALFSSAPGSGQSAFPAPVGPAGGTAPPRSIWGISPAVPVEDAFSHPSFGSSVLGGTTSSAASIVGGSGVGAPAAIPASSATKSIEHAALQGIPSGSSALDKSKDVVLACVELWQQGSRCVGWLFLSCRRPQVLTRRNDRPS